MNATATRAKRPAAQTASPESLLREPVFNDAVRLAEAATPDGRKRALVDLRASVKRWRNQ